MRVLVQTLAASLELHRASYKRTPKSPHDAENPGRHTPTKVLPEKSSAGPPPSKEVLPTHKARKTRRLRRGDSIGHRVKK